jgi:glycosyltransferase involved in cell wall biosynthesis
MRFVLLCKRYYTNKDLLGDRFGRLYHLPRQLALRDHEGLVLAVDYRGKGLEQLTEPGVTFESQPLRPRTPFLAFWRLWRRMRDFRPDMILASGDTYLGALALLFARCLGVPFAFDIYDDYTAFRSARLPGMTWLFHQVVRRADLVICASRPLADWLCAFNSKIHVIENGVDPALFRPLDKDAAREALGIGTAETVVGFFGSLAVKRGGEVLIEAADLMRADDPQLRLLISGANSMGLDLARSGIDYRGHLPQEQVPMLINACDVVVIPYQVDQQVSFQNPCKIAEYLACGVPIVATRVSDHAEILAAAPQGLCRPDDTEDLARAIRDQLRAPQQVEFDPRLTWESLGAHLNDILPSRRDGRAGNPG